MFASRLTSLRARLSARLARAFALTAISATALTTVACSSGELTAPTQHPVAIQQDASKGLISTLTSTVSSTLTEVVGLTWSKPIGAASATKVIGPDGGSFSIPNGIKVIVPKGAVSRNITFSVTRLAGNAVAYDFQPHGTTFAVPVQIEQPTLGTNLLKWSPTTRIRGAYFPETSLLNTLTGSAFVSEFRPTIVSADKAWIKFTVDHFSGYMVSMD